MHDVTRWLPTKSVSRADMAARRALRALWETAFAPGRSLEAASALVGAPVGVQWMSARRGHMPTPLEGGLSIDVHGAEDAPDDPPAITLELEADLGVSLTARALKRPPPRVPGPLENAEAASISGGVAAVLRAATRRCPRGPLRVSSAGLGNGNPRRGHPPGLVDVAELRVTLDGEFYRARAIVAAREAVRLRWDRDRLELLRSAPLELTVVADSVELTAADVAALGVGDALLLGSFSLGRALAGAVALAAPGAERGAAAELAPTGKLVLRAGAVELSAKTLSQQGDTDAVVESLGDVPVVVRVEVGTARMSAREWADLAPGDVVTLAHKLADPVTLRVGGVAVAEGELVEVEGEIGVRILARRGEERAP